ncbi:MAG TPA: hypothetical protein VFC15_00780 [Candidatus Limnocylindrales bacterium]|jgi:hypothetical protein|nr:hypothetical protein [Candidatus Limnocylindrales bacterium]
MSWRDYSFAMRAAAACFRNTVLYRRTAPKRKSKVVRSSIGKAARLCLGSSDINGATGMWQAGLEKHQSGVKLSKAFRVLPQSVQRAKLQGCAESNAFGEGTRGFR